MSKMHIDVRDGISYVTALECVRKVVDMGRVSKNGTMFCYGTSFLTEEGLIWVFTRDYRKSDCFCVCKNKNEHE